MNWTLPPNLKSAQLLRRYKRFLADVRFDNGQIHTVHCPNPGRMTTCMAPNCRVWISESTNPKRKLKWTWELSEINGSMVLINTQRSNLIVRSALTERLIPELSGYGRIEAEKKLTKGVRIDFLLTDHLTKPACWVEVKNATLLVEPGMVAFPDSITVRGVKQLKALADHVSSDCRVAVVYLIARQGCDRVRSAVEIDRHYAAAAVNARRSGVEFYALQVDIDTHSVAATGPGTVVWK